MAFHICRVEDKEACQAFFKLSELHLAGPQGILAKWLQLKKTKNNSISWVIDQKELLECSQQTGPMSIIFQHSEENSDSCYELMRLSGDSSENESTVLLHFKIRAIKSCKNKHQSDHFCIDPKISSVQLSEAIVLTGGFMGGTYVWKAPKMNIGGAIVG